MKHRRGRGRSFHLIRLFDYYGAYLHQVDVLRRRGGGISCQIKGNIRGEGGNHIRMNMTVMLIEMDAFRFEDELFVFSPAIEIQIEDSHSS